MTLIRALDISGLFHPIWRVKESQARPIGEAAAETVQALREHAARSGADFVVACCDAPGPTFRHAIAEEFKASKPDYRGYKGDRPPRDPAMMAALDRVIDELEQDGIPIMRVPGFEADDAIATITRWAIDNGHDVEIVSEDKDLLSLVRDADLDTGGPSVIVIRRDGTRQDADACVRRLGVPPALVPAFLALRSDVSDGVLGIPQVGDTTATALLWGKYEGKEWRPTPYKRFDDIVNAAVEEQATIEPIERDILARRVHTAVKKGFADDVIADKLKITLEDVERMKAAPEPPKPPDYKAKFARDVRQNLIAYAANFDIGLRLTRLREDVPLDFAAVTAPRTPKVDKAKAAERDALLARAHAEADEEDRAAVAAAQEEQSMSTIDAEFTDAATTSEQAPAPAPATAAAPSPPPAQAIAPAPAAQAPTAAANSNGAKQTQAIAVVRPFEQQLEARSLSEAQWLAKSIAASRKIKDAGDENAVLLKLTVGRSLGMTLYQCLRMYLMEGQVAMRTQQVLARVKSSPLCEYIRLVHLDDQKCTWVTKRRGEPEQARTFTIEQARRAMLGGIKVAGGNFDPQSAWAKWTEDMLSARAVMPLMRQEYPEIADGYSTEELGDDPRAGSIDTTGEAA